MRKLGIVLAALVTLSGNAFAEGEIPDHVPFGEPTFKGSGCEEGSMTFSPTESAFTILFDNYYVEDGPGLKFRDRFKRCNMIIPIEIPEGWQVAIDSIDYRGYASLDQNAKALLRTYFVMRGQRFVSYGGGKPTRFKGVFDDDFERRDEPRGKEKHRWSRCGGSLKLKLGTYMYTRARKGDSSYLALDSVDGAASLRYGMTWKRCK